MKHLRGPLLAIILMACTPQPVSPEHPNRFVKPIGLILDDPAQVDFFAAEAARANVTSIRAVHGQPGGGGITYGMTTWKSNGNTADIRIFVDVPGARTPTNLAHEISHAAAYRRGCFNHGNRWLAYHREIAQRYEAQFPGVKWSGSTPTQNVARKALRYPGQIC